MRPPVEGAVALVTGASSGIGREIAKLLAPKAKVLILVARRVDRLEALRTELARPGLTVEVEGADLGDRASTKALADRVLARHGAIDVLVNNAGLGDVELFERAKLEKLEQVIDVNIVGLTILTHELLPPMLKKGRGGILNVSSGWGLTLAPALAVYAASKHYVTAFSECLRMELSGTGVVVSQVCPGPIPTEFESVAGNPTGQKVPGVVQISAERCAKIAVGGFERGRALIMPGLVISSLTRLGMWTPRVILRLAYGWIGGYLRKRAPV